MNNNEKTKVTQGGSEVGEGEQRWENRSEGNGRKEKKGNVLTQG